MNVLVTGGGGFIGTHLCEALRARGDHTYICDLRNNRNDVRDPVIVAKRLEKCDAVIHLAARVGVGESQYRIRDYVDTNVNGTATLLEAIIQHAPRIQKLVVASSMSVYGEGPRFCRACDRRFVPDATFKCPRCGRGCANASIGALETQGLRPQSVYAITKRDQEELCLTVGRAYKIPTVALRFFNCYGSGQSLSNPYTGAIAIFASRLLNSQPPMLYEDGEQSRDFIHVSDVVRAILLALDSSDAGAEVYNVGTGIPTSIMAVATQLQALLGGPAPQRLHQKRAGDIRHCYADTSKAEERLGFTAQVKLADGLRDLAPWLAAQHAEDRTAEAQRELVERGLVA